MASEDGKQGSSRMPKNMKGLLKFCVETTKNEDASHASTVEEMSPDKKKWLEEALEGLSESPVQRMIECIKTIKTADDQEDGVDKKVAALEELTEWSEQIDFAIDFHKIGGFDIFEHLLFHEESELRWLTLELIATLVQNNPYCQTAVLVGGLLPVLLELLDKDGNATVQIKAMLAVSCLIRDVSEGQRIFIENDGFSVLMRAMQSDVEKLKIKAAFLLKIMCVDQPSFKDILCDIGMIDQLVGHLSEEHSFFQEHLMGSLLTLVQDHSRSLEECLRPELNLMCILQQRIEFLTDKEEFQEEQQCAKELLKILQKGNGETAVAR